MDNFGQPRTRFECLAPVNPAVSTDTGEDLSVIYSQRFSSAEKKMRQQLWQVLCESFFQKYIDEDESALDLGAGYCDFINHIKARQKIAVVLNPDVAKYAGADVLFHEVPSTDLSVIQESSIDVVFASNVFLSI